jgi:hypothetical protein
MGGITAFFFAEKIPHNSLGPAGTEGSKPVTWRRLHEAPMKNCGESFDILGKRNRDGRVFAPLAKLHFSFTRFGRRRGALCSTLISRVA